MPGLDNPFWNFSVSVYGSPGVADECLALQERLGMDVNMLLFSVWAGTQGLVLSTPDFWILAEAVRDWQVKMVKPLRAIRRELKPLATKNPDMAALRASVQRDELFAEKIEQGLLYAMTDRLAGVRAEPAGAVRHNLAAVIAWHIVETAGASHQTEVAIDCPLLVSAAIKAA